VLNLSKIQFKSNSQPVWSTLEPKYCCAQSLKDTIQKQFTTVGRGGAYLVMLCSISQRYNSKAIHNALSDSNRPPSVVLNLSKIQFKSNSQHLSEMLKNIFSCAQSLKDTIQKQFTTLIGADTILNQLCSISQRYNSKAIHNSYQLITVFLSVVLNLSKIQFKSNSQQLCSIWPAAFRCAQSLKDTIQKQFTTSLAVNMWAVLLCSISQRYNSKAIHNSPL